MHILNFNGSDPTPIQQGHLESLQTSARKSRLSSAYYPVPLLEKLDFSKLSPAQEEFVQCCHTVTSSDSLQKSYDAFLTKFGNGKTYLSDEALRKFINIEATKDLTCKYYRKFHKLEAQESVVSPEEIAQFAFFNSEAMYYAEVLEQFQKTQSGGRYISYEDCERFALDFKAQRQPSKQDILWGL